MEYIEQLESGNVVVFPELSFGLEADEQRFLEMKLEPKRAKNISYNPNDKTLRGLADLSVQDTLKK